MSDTETLQTELAENLQVKDDAEGAPKVESDSATAPSVSYPLKVQYCGECTLPLEYCSFSGIYEKCKAWREKNAEQLANEGVQVSVTDDDTVEGKKHQKRGGKGQVKATKVIFRK